MPGRARRAEVLGAVPPGWPPLVPPPESPGWQVPAVSWLLDHCPSDYRSYAGWRRQPVALAWVATRHIDARVELGDHLTSDGLAQVLADLEAEGVRLLAARRSAGLVYDALQGKRYVPRL